MIPEENTESKTCEKNYITKTHSIYVYRDVLVVKVVAEKGYFFSLRYNT